MKAVFDKSKLSMAVSAALGAVSSTSTLPILNNLLIKTSRTRNKAEIIATDLEITILMEIDAEVLEEGSITAPAKVLNEILKEITDKEVVLATNGSRLKVTAGKSNFNVNTIGADDFPMLKGVENGAKLNIPDQILLAMVKKTAFAVSNDANRRVLNGIHLVVTRNQWQLQATDGHRLSLAVDGVSRPEGAPDQRVIIPTKAVTQMLRLLKGNSVVDLAISETYLSISQGGITMFTRLIEGQFPNCEQVIPKEKPEDMVAVLKTKDLLEVLNRVSIVAPEKTNSVKMEFNPTGLTVKSSVSEKGESEEQMDLISYEGENIRIAINSKYLIEFLKVCDSPVVTIRTAR